MFIKIAIFAGIYAYEYLRNILKFERHTSQKYKNIFKKLTRKTANLIIYIILLILN